MTDPTWQGGEYDDVEEEYDARPWWQRYRTGLIIAGVIVLFALLSLPSILARDQIDTLEDDVSDLKTDLGQVRGQADANKSALDEANRILVQLGEEPVPVPDVDAEQNDPDPDDPEIQDPEIQDPEAADAEVQDPEVNDGDPFDDPDPNDPEFDDPDPDTPVSFEDIMRAVNEFCATHNDCKGDKGDKGDTGAAGTFENACPPGFHYDEALIILSGEGIGPTRAMVCVADDPPPTG